MSKEVVPDPVLLVVARSSLSSRVARCLNREGFSVVRVSPAGTPAALFCLDSPAAIVLEIGLAGYDGLMLCRAIRDRLAVPLLTITARGQPTDAAEAIEHGADDHLAEPFSMRELGSRINALLRRRAFVRRASERLEEAHASQVLAVGPLRMNAVLYTASWGGVPLWLRRKEFALLLFLAHNHGVALTHEQLLEAVWGRTTAENSRTLAMHIRMLREKFEADPSRPSTLCTVRGVGYRFAIGGGEESCDDG